MNATSSAIAAEYESKRPLYDAFTKSLSGVLHELILQRGIEMLPVECRTKSIESLSEKINREDKRGKYKKLREITDLAGIRVILYVNEDCENIAELIRSNFVVDEANSIYKSDELEMDRFGYHSVHIVVSYRNDRLRLPEFRPYKGLKAEIQIRTLLQHTWAAIDWKLRYKSTIEIPKPLRRRLYRISALLEAADDDFSFVIAESARISESYEDLISKGDLDIAIDRQSIAAFVADEMTRKPLSDILSNIEESGVRLDQDEEVGVARLIETCKTAMVDSISKLKNYIEGGYEKSSIIRLANDLWVEDDTVTSPQTSPSSVIRQLLILSLNPKMIDKVLNEVPFQVQFHEAFSRAMATSNK